MNNTTDISKDVKISSHLPVYGYPGTNFYVVHISALISLGTSIIVSSGVLLYLLTTTTIWNRPIGERLVAYLALADLLYSISHTVDHATMLAMEDHPPDVPCTIMAFFLLTFVSAQLFMITFIATNAFFMVVMEKKIELGRRDWKLLTLCFGGPTVCYAIMAPVGVLGPGGQWCLGDMRKTGGIIVTNIVAGTIVVVFLYNSISYLGIWMKVRRVAKSSATKTTDQKKYLRSARVMLLFVAAFILQWWAYVIYCIWNFFTEPHVVIIVGAVTFSNMGGLFNFLAYTYIRKKQANVQPGTSTEQTATTRT